MNILTELILKTNEFYTLVASGVNTNVGFGNDFLTGKFDFIKLLASACFYMVLTVGGIKISINLVMSIINYFKANDERQREEEKQMVKTSAIGLLALLIASVLINFILKNLFGIDIMTF